MKLTSNGARRWYGALIAVLAAFAGVWAPAASAHTGGAKCDGALAERGSTYEAECAFPFQGFPIGVAGVHDSEPNAAVRTGLKDAEIHVEVLAKLAAGPLRPLGIECVQAGKGVVRCEHEYNPLGPSVTAFEPMPSQILGLVCSAHSHAKYSRLAPPAGKFACWSSDEAREDLEQDGFFRDAGFEEEEEEPAPEEPSAGSGPLGPLGGSGLSSTVTTVPLNTYAPQTVVVSRSLGLSYVNVDLNNHDVVAFEAKRPDGSAPWCGDFEDPEDPGAEDCPLFWTPLIPGGGSQTPVLGLEDTSPGESYSFYCSIHPYMKGTIEVVE